ncbi:unnamed protein product [Parnassius apollo]|uniref:(apollo) hypothetical protein n=1 Tax=Parnassius apollo TaxID=110799 RepID=A0A8S3X0F4_PARAO|nr:unnamed protein product [Parnassius apollo]
MIRVALDANVIGLRGEKMRKSRNQKVIIDCDTREKMVKVADRLNASNTGLLIDKNALNNFTLIEEHTVDQYQ